MKSAFLILLSMTIFACNTPEEKQIPHFSFTSIDGENVTRTSLKGEATVICVWATWCGDCIREIPELNELAAKYKNNERVNFIAFSDEDEPTVRKSLARFPFHFTHIVNAKEYSDQLKTGVTKHFPQVLVVNKDLEVIYEVTENKEKIFSILDSHIQDILK
jgi:thiol-disulfide isomerase/thioredoxin